MPQSWQIAPATTWRAFCFLLLAAGGLFAAPAPKPPELSQFGKPDAAEAARLIEGVRQAGIAGQYFLEFELHALPLRGEEKVFKGALWGGRNEQGVVMRIELVDDSGKEHRLLLQNGANPSVTRWAGDRVAPLEPAQLLAPVIPGVDVSAFDLQMPYLYWPDPIVEKITRSILGRPANVFLFKAPAEFIAQHPEVSAVRANLDTQYNAIIQTEVLGPDGQQIVKSFALLAIKRIGDQAVPKQVDYRNDKTRNKTRLQITGASLRLNLPPQTFDRASLVRPATRPPSAQIVHIDP
jgi:hypothetical protein